MAAWANNTKKAWDHPKKEEVYALIHEVILYVHMQGKPGRDEWILKLRSGQNLAWEDHIFLLAHEAIRLTKVALLRGRMYT